MRRLIALLLIPALALAAGACRAKPQGTVDVVVIGAEPKVRDPALGPLTSSDAILLQNAAQGLVRFDAGGNIVGALARSVRRVWEDLPQRADIHPDVWDPIVISSGVSLVDVLRRDAGPKYSYRELDDFTDRIEKAIKIAPEASRVTRVGVIEEQIEARYSQNRLAALGIIPAAVRVVLQSRNTTVPAGTVNAEGRELALEQTGEFRTLADIDRVVFTQAANGTPQVQSQKKIA